jgi:hypothetical protein
MNRRLIWLLVVVGLCACQTGGGPVSSDCPSLNPCDEAGQDVRPLFAAPVVTLATAMPLWPGCPSTLQVMARPHPIVFRAVRPDEEPETAPDPSDWVCEMPEAPLLRTDWPRSGQAVAGR